MPDVLSAVGTVTTGPGAGNMGEVATQTYDLLIRKPLRSRLWFDPIATIGSTKQSHRGASVTFSFVGDLAAATTPLSETVDVDAVGLSDSTNNVTMTEYGNAVVTTAKLRGMTHTPVDPVAAERISRNAALTIDTLARTALEATTNVVTDTAANLSAGDIRSAFVNLQENNVETWDGEFYLAFIHPRQALDLRAATAVTDWRAPQVYGNDQRMLLNGEIGAFEGFRFIVTNRVSTGGTGLTGTFNSLFLGAEALAKAYSSAPGFGSMPGVVMGEVTDKLRRFQPVGWYWLGGYKVFRNECVRKVITRSSLGV
jgi:N4-gp56 family major capsid protein